MGGGSPAPTTPPLLPPPPPRPPGPHGPGRARPFDMLLYRLCAQHRGRERAFGELVAAGLARPLALADRDPERKIARLRAGAGEGTVAQARRAGWRLAARA